MKKFKENLDTAVFTTRFVLESNSPILFVFHFEDGAWQFSGSEENLNDNDFRVVSLAEIIKIDSSVLAVSDLPLDSEAERKSSESAWFKKK
jgi:hypothetical protein